MWISKCPIYSGAGESDLLILVYVCSITYPHTLVYTRCMLEYLNMLTAYGLDVPMRVARDPGHYPETGVRRDMSRVEYVCTVLVHT